MDEKSLFINKFQRLFLCPIEKFFEISAIFILKD